MLGGGQVVWFSTTLDTRKNNPARLEPWSTRLVLSPVSYDGLVHPLERHLMDGGYYQINDPTFLTHV